MLCIALSIMFLLRNMVLRFPAMLHTQREIWNGDPERLPDAFRMTKPKGERTIAATCEVHTHQFGRELRLMIDGHGLQMSSVVRSADEMLTTVEKWHNCDARERLELMLCHCADGWICEQHPDRPWPHDGCPGPGELCRNPECVVGRVLRAELDDRRAPQRGRE
jgi:hypothetical protein